VIPGCACSIHRSAFDDTPVSPSML
jgi:hypothetical protein